MSVVSFAKNTVRRFPTLDRLIRQTYNHRVQLAARYLHGVGLEIGALDRPLLLPRRARALYLDRFHPRDLRIHYPELGANRLYVSLVDDGESLHSVRDDALDFIVANHVIEHCEDPIATLKVWNRCLKRDGILFMAVPDMRFTFDRNREPTTWEHLLADHQSGTELSRASHYLEWAQHVNGLSGVEAQRRADELMALGYRVHFHCWTRETMTNFLESLKTIIPFEMMAVDSWRDENIFLLRKTG